MELYTLNGIVVDAQTSEPIKGAKVMYSTSNSVTNSKGEFKINIPLLKESEDELVVSLPNYGTQKIIPYKGNGEPQSQIIFQLNSTQADLSSDIAQSSQLTEEQLNILTSGQKDAKFFAQKKLNDSIGKVKNTLVPFTLTLIAGFGVVGAQKLILEGKTKAIDIPNQFSCPTPQELASIINKKNKLVKQINQTLKVIDISIKAVGITGGIIEALNVTFLILKNLPLPSAVGGVGLPVSVINNIQDAKNKLSNTITTLSSINAGVLVTLIILRQTLTQALQLLSLLDNLIQHCAPDNPASQEVVSLELAALTQQESQQQSPIITNVNGFEMGVETEITENPLKRRRAIARNKKGVVMLEGEWSFSSIDQILIDELVFYIQTNNLKAD
jgi:hypothetical protein